MTDDLFVRTARQHRLEAPGILASAEAWEAYCRLVWARFPAWGYDATFIGEAAKPFLPRVLAQMGLGRLIGWISDDPVDAIIHGIRLPDRAEDWSWRWLVDHARGLALIPLRDGPDASGMLFRLTPDPDAALLVLCRDRHDWRCPTLARQGEDLVELGAWRWDVGKAKSAYRIARLAGLQRAAP